MADNVSIVMTLKTDIESKLKTIASTSHGCSKEFEEFQRRAVELGDKFNALNTRYDKFNEEAAKSATRAEHLKLEMSDLTKAARKSGQELDEVSFNNLKKRVPGGNGQRQGLRRRGKGYSQGNEAHRG